MKKWLCIIGHYDDYEKPSLRDIFIVEAQDRETATDKASRFLGQLNEGRQLTVLPMLTLDEGISFVR